MFKKILNAVWIELLGFLKDNPGFLQQDALTKKEWAAELKVPTPFVEYLLSVDEKELLKDLERTIAYQRNPQRAIPVDSGFFKAFMNFFVISFGIRMDFMWENASEPEDFRRTVAEKLIPSGQGIGAALRELLLRASYQEISSELIRLGKHALRGSHLVVQSPRNISAQLKKEIRHALAEQFPSSFPLFQVNRKLIGGFRLFKDGETIDYSWISRVLRFQKLLAA